jgi:YVTN family beta-propeller protein
MPTPRNYRLLSLLLILAIGALTLLAFEHRPSFLRPGLRLHAYVPTADGTLTVLDLVKLQPTTRISIGQKLSGVHAHPTRNEIWGVSTTEGFVWILDTTTNQITARIPVGPLPYTLEFSPDHDATRAYVTTSGNNNVTAIDTRTHQIIATAKTGKEPVLARITPDGKSLLVANRADNTISIHDAITLQLRTAIPVVEKPEDLAILPDNSLAFVRSASEPRISVVDLRRGVLLTHLELAGRPTQMLLKPDGGELYVISPEAHGLQVINTASHEVGDYMELGSAPTRAVLSSDASLMYVSDSAANRIIPVDIGNRRLDRDPAKGFPVPAGQSPGALSFDPQESLLLAVDQDSADITIIRVRTNYLVTMIPVGPHPSDLAIKLF